MRLSFCVRSSFEPALWYSSSPCLVFLVLTCALGVAIRGCQMNALLDFSH